MPLTLKGYARIRGEVRPLYPDEIKRQAIQLLISHSKEINRNLPSSSKLITHVLMIRTDKDKMTASQLICLLRRGIQYFSARVQKEGKEQKTYLGNLQQLMVHLLCNQKCNQKYHSCFR